MLQSTGFGAALLAPCQCHPIVKTLRKRYISNNQQEDKPLQHFNIPFTEAQAPTCPHLFPFTLNPTRTMGDPSEGKRKKQKRSMSTGEPGPAAAGAGTGPSPNADDDTPVGRKWTLSIALPGSLLDNPPSLDAAVCTAAQIARTAAAFQVDEVVVYDDTVNRLTPATATATTVSPGTALLARLLQYFDTPPHLRPNLYDSGAVAAVGGTMEEFKLAAAMPQPSPPHHARPGGVGAWMPYREGVVLKSEDGAGSYVDVGLDRMVWLEHQLPQVRVC